MLKFATLLILLASAVFAQEMSPLRAGQPEISGGVSITHSQAGRLTKAGLTVDGGVLVHPNFAIIGEYNLTPLGSESLTYHGVHTKASARFHSIQAGGRVNILSRGRVIPYVAGTAGMLRLGATGSVNSPYVSYSDGASESVFGFGVGGGFIVRASNHVEMKVDVRGLKGNDIGWLARATVGVGYRF